MTVSRHPEFPLMDGIIYLNHAAVAPWPKRTADCVKAFAEENVQKGAYDYPDWLKKESLLREQLKNLINASSTDDIALVKNTSEALSFVAYGLEWKPGDNIVSSDEEFPSNRIPWQSLYDQGIQFRQANLSGALCAEDVLFERVDKNTRLITVSSIQFASGLRLDLEKIGYFCRQHKILFCIDAIQSLGAVRFDAQACCADFVMADGHKWMLGPEGLGVFYTNPQSRDRLRLTQYGWHMIKNSHNYDNKPWDIAHTSCRFECGSPNMLSIHALSESLSLLLETGMESVERLVLKKARRLIELIRQHSELSLLSPLQPELQSGIVLFRHNQVDNTTLFQFLRKQGVVCAQRGKGIRFSPHFYTPDTHIEKAIEIVLRCRIESD